MIITNDYYDVNITKKKLVKCLFLIEITLDKGTFLNFPQKGRNEVHKLVISNLLASVLAKKIFKPNAYLIQFI